MATQLIEHREASGRHFDRFTYLCDPRRDEDDFVWYEAVEVPDAAGMLTSGGVEQPGGVQAP